MKKTGKMNHIFTQTKFDQYTHHKGNYQLKDRGDDHNENFKQRVLHNQKK